MNLFTVAFVFSVAWLVACGAGTVLCAVWRIRGNGLLMHPWAFGAPRIVGALPLVGLIVAFASMLPAHAWLWLKGLCACQAYGGRHVCPFHFQSALPLLLVALPFGALLFVRRVPCLVKVVRRTQDQEHVAVAEQPRADGLVAVDQGGAPMVFVAGIRCPRIIVERVWWDSLTPREQAVIRAHETAHVDARDPAVVAALEFLLQLFAPNACTRILRDWTLASEVRADAAAAQRDGDPVYLAELLCRYARTASLRGATLGLGGSELNARVYALLDGRTPPVVNWRASTLGAGVVGACVSGHLLHRAFETLLLAL